MATYYKYAERNAEDYVDWGAIGKTMSDTLLKEQQNRDKMKAEIDAASREFGETLMNAPQGEHKGMTNYALEFADNAQQYQLMQLKNLKSGKLLLKDYLVGRENLKQGTSDAFGIIEKYQQKYGEYMQRFEEGKAAGLETFLLGEVEGFGNLTSSSLYINPSNGQVSAGKRVPRDPNKPYDPQTNPYTAKMSDNPNDFRTLNELNFALSSQIDKFDAAAATDGIIDSFAKTYETITMGKRGAMTKVDDIRQLGEDGKEFVSALDTKIKAMFETNPLHALSTIQDFLIYGPDGEEITLTRDPSEANEHTILLKSNPEQPEGGMPVADFSSESGQKILEYMREKMSEQVIAGLNRKVAATAERAPQRASEASIQRGLKLKSDRKNINLLADLYYGSKAEVSTALDNLRGVKTMGGMITKITRTDTGVTINTPSGSVTVEFGAKSPTEFVEAISSEFGMDFNKAVRGANIQNNKDIATVGDLSAERKLTESVEDKAYTAYQTNINTIKDVASAKKIAGDYGVPTGESGSQIYFGTGKNAAWLSSSASAEELKAAVSSMITGDKIVEGYRKSGGGNQAP